MTAKRPPLDQWHYDEIRRHLHYWTERGSFRGLALDIIGTAEMGLEPNPIALRELADIEAAANERYPRDPNQGRIVGLCRAVRDIAHGVVRCPYCQGDTREPGTAPGCLRFKTHAGVTQ